MKLLHVITSLDIGGAQRLLSELIPIQKKRNQDVSLLVLKRVDNDFTWRIECADINILRLKGVSLKNPINIFRLKKVLKDFDIVHVHLFPTLYWAALAVLNYKNVKLVYTEHSTHNKRRDRWYFRPIEKYIYSKYNKIISISQQTQSNLTKWLDAKENDSRFVVIENGINIESFNLSLPLSSRKQIIMVSRFAEMKDQETVIKAMKYVTKEAELVFVGDGPNRKHCQEIACEEGVADRVFFLGARSDIPQLVAQAYIGVQSSKWEGFGLTAVEIMAAHKPVIATNVEGLKQVVEGAGCLFNVGDAEALASHINVLLKNDLLYNEIADKCYMRAREYDISKMAARYQDVYNELLNG